MPDSMSIIIPSLNEGDNLERTVRNMIVTIGLEDYEIIVVNEGGTETSSIRNLPKISIYETGRQGSAQARNFGAAVSNKNVLLFADAHIEFKRGWGKRLLRLLELDKNCIIAPCITRLGDEESRGCGYRWADPTMEIDWLPDSGQAVHEVPFAIAACLAIEKRMFQEIGRFDSGIRFYGEEDTELCLRAWLLGYRVLCDPAIRVGHLFRDAFPYEIHYSNQLYNQIRLAFSHFGAQRLTSYLRTLYDIEEFDTAFELAMRSDVLPRRVELFKKRVHSDNWFFKKFPMPGWTSIN